MGEFFKDFIAESKRVIWPNKKELITKTTSVIAMSIVVAGIIFVYDLVFSQSINLLLSQFVK
jgi:preprotein translocase subunit SecE